MKILNLRRIKKEKKYVHCQNKEIGYVERRMDGINKILTPPSIFRVKPTGY